RGPAPVGPMAMWTVERGIDLDHVEARGITREHAVPVAEQCAMPTGNRPARAPHPHPLHATTLRLPARPGAGRGPYGWTPHRTPGARRTRVRVRPFAQRGHGVSTTLRHSSTRSLKTW